MHTYISYVMKDGAIGEQTAQLPFCAVYCCCLDYTRKLILGNVLQDWQLRCQCSAALVVRTARFYIRGFKTILS